MNFLFSESPPRLGTQRDENGTTTSITRRSPRKSQDADIFLPSIMPPTTEISPFSTPTSPSKRKRRRSSNRRSVSQSVEAYLIFGWVFSFIFGYCLLYRWQITLPARTLTVLNTTINITHIKNLRAPSKSGLPDVSDDEEPNLVHIMHSRFMQHQPSLIQLGMARLKLMEEFFLQTLHTQSSPNFLCIIRTDPDLDLTLRRRLLELLENTNLNYLVLASNDSPHSQYMDIMHQPNDVIAGNMMTTRDYLAKSRNVIETRLDVDDGLNRYFAEDIQSLAEDHFDAVKDNKSDDSWKIWCAASSMEWQFQSPKALDYKKKSLDNKQKSNSLENSGSLVSLRSTLCITAGLTVAFVAPEGIQKLDFPSTSKHTKIHHNLSKCNSKHYPHGYGCFDFFKLVPTALRARTPSSAGMQNILWPSNSTNITRDFRYRQAVATQQAAQPKFWNITDYLFDFDEPTARQIHAYLETHMREIAEENLRGQCTHGHSCKEESRLLLQSIVQDYSR